MTLLRDRIQRQFTESFSLAPKMDTKGHWSHEVETIVKRCRLAAQFDMVVSWNAEGATALADVLEELAARVDEAERKKWWKVFTRKHISEKT